MSDGSEYDESAMPMLIPTGQRFVLKEDLWIEEHYMYRHGVLRGLTHGEARSGAWRGIVTNRRQLDRIWEKWLEWCGMRGMRLTAAVELPTDISCLDTDLQWYREHAGIAPGRTGRTCVDSPLPRRYAIFWEPVITAVPCVRITEDPITNLTRRYTYYYPVNYGIIRQWCSDCQRMGVRFLHVLSEYDLTFVRRAMIQFDNNWKHYIYPMPQETVYPPGRRGHDFYIPYVWRRWLRRDGIKRLDGTRAVDIPVDGPEGVREAIGYTSEEYNF